MCVIINELSMKKRNIIADVKVSIPIKNVINIFLDQSALSTWWGVDACLIEPRIGGIYTLVWGASDHGYKYISSGIIRSLSYRSLIIDRYIYLNPQIGILGPMQVKIYLTEQIAGTVLSVEQKGFKDGKDWDWYYEAVRAGWPRALQALKEYLELSFNK